MLLLAPSRAHCLHSFRFVHSVVCLSVPQINPLLDKSASSNQNHCMVHLVSPHHQPRSNQPINTYDQEGRHPNTDGPIFSLLRSFLGSPRSLSKQIPRTSNQPTYSSAHLFSLAPISLPSFSLVPSTSSLQAQYSPKRISA